jgi:hypothetical protein
MTVTIRSTPIKLEMLRELVDAGSVNAATIVGQTGGYAVVAKVGLQQRPLATKQGQVKMFANADTAIRTLRELGVFHTSVDSSNWHEGRLRSARPDVTQKAKAANTALAHDRWFRDQVNNVKDEIEVGTVTLIGHDALWDGLEAHAAKRVTEREGGVEPPSQQKRG